MDITIVAEATVMMGMAVALFELIVWALKRG